ncbi:MAG: hypothetical protein PT120_22090 [Aphanizomenon gracile PMC649.10]|jgi:hypothetical protein|uniref:hypothetical protein n=1 Tax=Dolichospermum sp. LEGE 00240 TaxID=1828603 RepID=UPI001D14282F|nr:hypothetical protein [Dolichospermum sp. LEGE 00240]MDM3847021.1 hypothetical protein [Aphanizomenon gracile PMC638.10]MDM3848698.1 hypothetical protein [Aphanizomenon gracile PMC627.10]MDM3857504.1 hypothetical protein [Aphanizomenon gracile PMC649.10]MDM3861623.1 hypothetical protein [Aphanizomenon gracile PMC644.10]
MIFLVDYNLDGYAVVLLGILVKNGWLELLSIRFVTFREADLSMDSSDRTVWCYAQTNQMMILPNQLKRYPFARQTIPWVYTGNFPKKRFNNS